MAGSTHVEPIGWESEEERCHTYALMRWADDGGRCLFQPQDNENDDLQLVKRLHSITAVDACEEKNRAKYKQ